MFLAAMCASVAMVGEHNWHHAPSDNFMVDSDREPNPQDGTPEFEQAFEIDCGNLATRDMKKAVKLYELAAEKGHIRSAGILAGILRTGDYGIRPDLSKAIELATVSSNGGDPFGHYQLARLTSTGLLRDGDDHSERLLQAFSEFNELAERHDDPQAMNFLGLMLADGFGVSQDLNAANKWFQKSAELGYPPSQYNWGRALTVGDGVEVNHARGMHWFQQAHSRGYSKATTSIGLCHIQGRGVPKDEHKGIEFYELAVKNGSSHAALNLAYHYGSCQQPDLANQWIETAASMGNTTAIRHRSQQAYKNNDFELALQTALRGASLGDLPCAYNAGGFLFHGRVCEQDRPKAMELLRQAARGGLVEAQLLIGELLLRGTDVDQDMSEARSWFLKAARQNSAQGQMRIAGLMISGVGGEKNVEDGVQWLEKAAALDNPKAQFTLGSILIAGEYTSPDDRRAFELFEKAAAGGITSAKTSLGFLLITGRGCEQNVRRAVRSWKSAARAGDVSALKNLACYYSSGEFVEKDLAKFKSYIQQAAELGDPDAIGIARRIEINELLATIEQQEDEPYPAYTGPNGLIVWSDGRWTYGNDRGYYQELGKLHGMDAERARIMEYDMRNRNRLHKDR